MLPPTMFDLSGHGAVVTGGIGRETLKTADLAVHRLDELTVDQVAALVASPI